MPYILNFDCKCFWRYIFLWSCHYFLLVYYYRRDIASQSKVTYSCQNQYIPMGNIMFYCGKDRGQGDLWHISFQKPWYINKIASKITAPDYRVNSVKHLYFDHVTTKMAVTLCDLEKWVKVKWLIWDKVYCMDNHVGYGKWYCYKSLCSTDGWMNFRTWNDNR